MRLTGAGVLVYTVENGEILLLLGRERETPGWRQGSHKWSSFSGKVDRNENALEGAAREFAEETCACVPLGYKSTTTIADVASHLREYAHAVEQTTTSRGERLLYCTYILKVPHERFADSFSRTRAKLLELDGVFRNYYRAKKSAEAAPRFFLPGFILSSRIIVANFHVLSATEVEVTMHEDENASDLNLVFHVNENVSALLNSLEESWRRVQEFIALRSQDPILSHPAVNIVTSRNMIVSAFVNKAYLEKCEIKWWKLGDLLHAANNPITYPSESPFRKFFLENMSTLSPHVVSAEQHWNDAQRAHAVGDECD